MTKPSRFLENGFAAACGGSFCTESAESSENRIRLSGLTEPSVRDAQRRVGFAASDRFEPELDRARARRAGGRQRNRRALGAEGVGKPVADRAEQEALVIGDDSARRRRRAAGRRSSIGPLAPEFARQSLRAAAIRSRSAPRQGTAAPGNGLAIRSRPRAIASSMAISARRSASAAAEIGLDGDEIDGAGDRGLQGVGREIA